MNIFEAILKKYELAIYITNDIMKLAVVPKKDKTLDIDAIKNHTQDLDESYNELNIIINSHIIERLCPLSAATVIKEIIEIIKKIILANEELQDISIKYIDYTFINKNYFLNRRFTQEIEKKYNYIIAYLNDEFLERMNELAIIAEK